LYGKIQMNYRIDKMRLLEELTEWNRFLKRKIHLIACGGTAMTLLGVKPSTKDIDFMVPDPKEYEYLLKQLKALGYEQVTTYGWKRPGEIFQFDLFRENRIHTTELLESPLEDENHTLLKEYSQLYIGILNDYDLIVSKLMRGTRVDFEDCLMLAEAHWSEIDPEKLRSRFLETVEFDVNPDRLRPNIDTFFDRLKGKGLL